MGQIHKQTIYKALGEPIFAKDVFSKLPPSEFGDGSYKIIVRAINRYYKTNDQSLGEASLLTLVEERMTNENMSAEKQDEVIDAVHDLYKLDETDTGDEVISESIQKFVRRTLARETIMKAVNKGDISDDKVLIDLVDGLRDVLTTEVGGNSGEIIDFFEDTEKKLALFQNLQVNTYPTGFFAIDSVAGGGLARGELGLVIAPSGGGKALTNHTPVKTPNGDVPIGDIKVGQKVFGRNGKVQTVKGVFPQGKLPVYLVEFSDGTVIECNDEHLWTYQTKSQRGIDKTIFKTNTLRYIIDHENLETKQGTKNLYIPMAEPVEYEEKDLFIPPYTLGALIGDGSFRSTWTPNFTNSESDIVDRVNKELATLGFKLGNRSSKQPNEYSVNWLSHEEFKHETKGTSLKQNKIKSSLVELGLWGKKSGDKFIPDIYLKSSISQRLALLQGLLDTDGWARNGSYSYTTKSEQLAKDVKELVESLGGTAKLRHKIVNNATYYVLTIKNGTNYSYHASEKHSKVHTGGQAKAFRQIVSITETNRTEEMTCISVDSPDSLFLTTDYVVTHNTMWAVNQTRNYVRQGLNVLYLPLEEKLDRMLLRFEQVLSKVKKTTLLENDEVNEPLFHEIQRLFKYARKEYFDDVIEEDGKEVPNPNPVHKNPNQWGNLWIRKYKPQELTPSMLSQLISDVTIRKGKRVDVVMIDYPDLMKNPHFNGGNESDAGGKLYEDIRAIIQEYDVVGWALSQVNRSSYVQDIKNAGAIEGSKRKINAVELAFTINQTPEEFANGFLRVYLDKIRNNSGVSYDRIQYFKVIPETMEIRDETPEEREQHMRLLEDTGELGSKGNKKEKVHTPQEAQAGINDLNSKLRNGEWGK